MTQTSCESRRSRQGTNGNEIGKNMTRNHELAHDLKERDIAAERPRSPTFATTRVPPKGVSDVLVHYLDQCCIDRLVRRVVYFAYKINIPKLPVCKPTCPTVWPPGSLAHWLSACLAGGHFSNTGAVTAATPAAAPSAIGSSINCSYSYSFSRGFSRKFSSSYNSQQQLQF